MCGPSIPVVMVAQCSGNSGIKSEKNKAVRVFWVITLSFCVAVQERGGTFPSPSPALSPLFQFFSVLAGSIASCPQKAYSAHSADKGLQGGNRKEIVQKV